MSGELILRVFDGVMPASRLEPDDGKVIYAETLHSGLQPVHLTVEGPARGLYLRLVNPDTGECVHQGVPVWSPCFTPLMAGDSADINISFSVG